MHEFHWFTWGKHEFYTYLMEVCILDELSDFTVIIWTTCKDVSITANIMHLMSVTHLY